MAALGRITTLVAIKIDCLQHAPELIIRCYRFNKELHFKHIPKGLARYPNIQGKIILAPCIIKESEFCLVIKNIKVATVFIFQNIICSQISVNTSANKELARACRLLTCIAWYVEIICFDAVPIHRRNAYIELVFVFHKHSCAHKGGGIIAFKECFFIACCKGEIHSVSINGDCKIFFCLCSQFFRFLICDFDDHLLGFQSDLGLHGFQIFFHAGHIAFHFIEEIFAKERGFKRGIALRTDEIESPRYGAIEHRRDFRFFLTCRDRTFSKHFLAFIG